MMDHITRMSIATRIAVTGFITGMTKKMDDRGQGSVEYVGIILVVVAIVGAIVAFGDDIGETISDKIKEAVGKID